LLPRNALRLPICGFIPAGMSSGVWVQSWVRAGGSRIDYAPVTLLLVAVCAGRARLVGGRAGAGFGLRQSILSVSAPLGARVLINALIRGRMSQPQPERHARSTLIHSAAG